MRSPDTAQTTWLPTVITRKPSRTAAGRRPSAPAGGAVAVDPEIVATISAFGMDSKRRTAVHYALWRAAASATVDGGPHGLSDEWMYDAMGSLASTLRHVEVEAPSTFHYALNRLNLTLQAIQRMEGDPVKQGQARSPSHRTLKAILVALERELAKYLKRHPEYVLNHAQWAGLEPVPEVDKRSLGELGEKPEFLRQRKKGNAANRAGSRLADDAPDDE